MPDAPLNTAAVQLTDGLPAFLVVLAIAAGAVLTALAAARLLRLDEIVRSGLKQGRIDTESLIREIRVLAEQTASYGLASLGPVAGRIRDPFLRRALQLTIATPDAGALAARLEHDLDRGLAVRGRRARLAWLAARAIAALGPFTLLTSVAMMLRVQTSAGAIGPVWAAAVLSTSLLAMALITLALPVGRARLAAADEFLGRTLIVAGLVAVREGQSPAAVEARLVALLPRTAEPLVRAAA